MTPRSTGSAPVVLVVDDEEWTARTLESVLNPSGFAVIKTYTGAQAVQLAGRVRPDAVVVARHLPDTRGDDLLRSLKDVGVLSSSTPSLVFASGPLTRAERISYLEAGAWEILSPPLDSDEMVLKLRTFLAAKSEVDQVRDLGMVDPSTGLYNVNGIIRRLDEILSGCARYHRPLACVIVGGPVDGWDATQVDQAASALSDVLNMTVRRSDIVGRAGQSDFVILAPDTSEEGARDLCQRLLDAMAERVERGEEWARSFRAGFYASPDPATQSADASDFLTRAKLALKNAQKNENGGGRISAYGPI